MKKLLTVVVMLCMVLGIGSIALAQTGEVSADLWFTNHVWQEDTKVDTKHEAAARLTGVKGEFDITNKIGVVGSFVFGKSEDFEKIEKNHGELTNMSLAVRYQVVPMVKAQAGFFTGGYTMTDGTTDDEYKTSGITIGAAVDFEVGDGIGIFGEANYAPLVNAKKGDREYKESTMMAFEAGGKYDFGQFAVKAGYRYQGFDFKEEKATTSSSATFSGFFVGGGVNF